jgi:hypothetical protein
MLSSHFLLLPFGLQMVCMAFDELHFHSRRGLPRWERIGHPLDTLTVLLCLLWILSVPPGPGALVTYAGLAIFSCLFVTKDEGVHLNHCHAAEQWVHALLFGLHPLVLLSAGLLWPAAHGIGNAWPGRIQYAGNERALLTALSAAVFGFGIFQFIYWNLIWRPPKALE